MRYGLAAPTGLLQIAPMTFDALHALVCFSKACRCSPLDAVFRSSSWPTRIPFVGRSRGTSSVSCGLAPRLNARPTKNVSVDSELYIHQRRKKEAGVKHLKERNFAARCLKRTSCAAHHQVLGTTLAISSDIAILNFITMQALMTTCIRMLKIVFGMHGRRFMCISFGAKPVTALAELLQADSTCGR